MKKLFQKIPETSQDVDKTKRIYRGVLDVIRRLEAIQKQSKGYRDVFLPEAVALRNKLHDYCERLLFPDPLEYGRKAEELLWRKAYYDIIQLMKHNRKQMRPNASIESAFQTHLVAATGYYQHLLLRLQYEYRLNLEGRIDFYRLPDIASGQKWSSTKLEPSAEVQDWALKACHRCLIYLGDIARYQQDYEHVPSGTLAQRYYFQAAALLPSAGMPYNQLGTLAGTRYYNVDAAYYYMRCLACQSSFEGAHGNLMRLFEKNRKRYHELGQQAPRDLPPEVQRSKDIRRFLVRFLYLMDLLHHSSTKLDAAGLQECCQATLQDFNLVLFYTPPQIVHSDSQMTDTPEDRSPHLQDEMVFKVIVMAISITHHLQKNGSRQMTAAMAFSLALFSHLLNHVVMRLQSAIYELENPQKLPHVDTTDLSPTPVDVTDDESVTTGSNYHGDDMRVRAASQERFGEQEDRKKIHKQKKFLQQVRRRRRRRKDSESTNSSKPHDLSGEDSDLSEGGFDSCSDSGDEVIDYMNGSDSSSGSEDDILKVSQELRPGFGHNPADGDSEASLLQRMSMEMKNGLGNNLSNGLDIKGEGDADNLKGFPASLLSDSNNFLQGTLRLASLLDPNKDGSPETAHIEAVVQGTTAVSVPPGFDKDPEAHHVHEISEKLVNFVIETDTELSSMPTDTDNSSLPTESEVDMIETDHDSADSIVDKSEFEANHMATLLQVAANEGLLQAVKVYCDWLLCNPHIITTCAQSTAALWTRLSVLLNLLPAESVLAEQVASSPWQVRETVAEARSGSWTPSLPLEEDFHLQGFVPLKEAHTAIKFKPAVGWTLGSKAEVILRICCLRRFGYQVDKMDGVQFTYASKGGCFYGPMQRDAQQDQQEAQEKMAAAEARRNQLMKDMAQLRLQAEVSKLEGSLQSSEQPSLPPYLIPDATALCDNLNQIKQLANSARFIVTIPLAVIDQLDFLKKENVGARDAIRWLEQEIRKGSRYVRAQKSHEAVKHTQPKIIKKRDRETWRFMQIVSCCKYLSQQGSESNAKDMVALLTNQDSNNGSLPLRLRQLIVTTKQEGLVIQKPADFFTKWKEVWKAGKG